MSARVLVLAGESPLPPSSGLRQRILHLTFHKSGANQLSATAPNGSHPHATCPRGYYMLFILDGNGVPSVGKFVHLH